MITLQERCLAGLFLACLCVCGGGEGNAHPIRYFSFHMRTQCDVGRAGVVFWYSLLIDGVIGQVDPLSPRFFGLRWKA